MVRSSARVAVSPMRMDKGGRSSPRGGGLRVFSSFLAAGFREVRNSGGMAGAFFLGVCFGFSASVSCGSATTGEATVTCGVASPAICISQASNFAQPPKAVATASSHRSNKTNVPRMFPMERHKSVTSPQPIVPPYQPDSAARRLFPPKTANNPKVRSEAISKAMMRPHLMPVPLRRKRAYPKYPMPMTMNRLPIPNQLRSSFVSGIKTKPPARLLLGISSAPLESCVKIDSKMANRLMSANATSANPNPSRTKRPNCVLKRASRSSQSFCSGASLCSYFR